jgi:cysteine desulfurase family protein
MDNQSSRKNRKMKRNILYFDNAATSWPKPETTIQTVDSCLRETGGSPGSSGHSLSIDAGRVIFNAREALAGLLGIDDPLRIVLTKNATEALNIAVFGLLKPGDHVITSSMEHNSVMRPLRAMEANGVDLTVLPCSTAGELDPGVIVPAIKKNTKAIILTHASNVTGTIIPVADIGRIAREHGLVFCVDAAQTAGALPIDIGAIDIDLLAFTGHKSLFGPQGTGGLYIRKDLDQVIFPLMRGGTGSRSEYEEQPNFMPDKFESGTPNTTGYAGLTAGIDFILSQGLNTINAHEKILTKLFLQGIGAVDGVKIYGLKDASRRIAVVSFNIRGIDPAKAALELDERFGIMSRSGIHCAPSAHKTIGTFPAGTVRFSFSYFNTVEEINQAVDAVRSLANQK